MLFSKKNKSGESQLPVGVFPGMLRNGVCEPHVRPGLKRHSTMLRSFYQDDRLREPTSRQLVRGESRADERREGCRVE